MNTITIDCGASFIKGALIDADGNILMQQRKQAPVIHGEDNILEPLQINALIPLVQGMIEELAGNEKELKLCISNEMHGFMLAYEDGRPYTDYISWQKEYGAIKQNGTSAVEILNSDEYKEDILKSGMPLRAGLPSCNLLFLKYSGYLEKVKSKLHFYTLGDYLIRRFTDMQPVCHSSNAAATGLYDIQKDRWNNKLTHIVGGEYIEFPKVGSQIITINKRGTIYHVYPAIGDQQAALLGAGLENERELSFNLGTGSQVSILVEKPEFGYGYQIRPYFKGKYIKTIPHLPSGRALNVYIRFFENVFEMFQIAISRDKIWQILLESAEQTKVSNLICDMSFFENPITDYTVGSIANIGEFDLSVGNLMMGILKQMVNNFLWAANQIQPDREKIEKILFSGGIAKKIEIIRRGIVENYSEKAIVEVASNETLIGLYRYGKE